ncbi:hypothetical protein HK102_010868, partial [Quaeritorhiza haematococci]
AVVGRRTVGRGLAAETPGDPPKQFGESRNLSLELDGLHGLRVEEPLQAVEGRSRVVEARLAGRGSDDATAFHPGPLGAVVNAARVAEVVAVPAQDRFQDGPVVRDLPQNFRPVIEELMPMRMKLDVQAAIGDRANLIRAHQRQSPIARQGVVVDPEALAERTRQCDAPRLVQVFLSVTDHRPYGRICPRAVGQVEGSALGAGQARKTDRGPGGFPNHVSDRVPEDRGAFNHVIGRDVERSRQAGLLMQQAVKDEVAVKPIVVGDHHRGSWEGPILQAAAGLGQRQHRMAQPLQRLEAAMDGFGPHEQARRVSVFVVDRDAVIAEDAQLVAGQTSGQGEQAQGPGSAVERALQFPTQHRPEPPISWGRGRPPPRSSAGVESPPAGTCARR